MVSVLLRSEENIVHLFLQWCKNSSLGVFYPAVNEAQIVLDSSIKLMTWYLSECLVLTPSFFAPLYQ